MFKILPDSPAAATGSAFTGIIEMPQQTTIAAAADATIRTFILIMTADLDRGSSGLILFLGHAMEHKL
jgi:hypothetical protein